MGLEAVGEGVDGGGQLVDVVGGDVVVGEERPGVGGEMREEEEGGEFGEELVRGLMAGVGERGQEGVGRTDGGVRVGSLEGGRRGRVPAGLGIVGGAVTERAVGLGVEGVLGVGEEVAEVAGVGEVGRTGVGDGRGRRMVEEFGGRLGGDEEVVALGGDGPFHVLGEAGQVVGGKEALCSAALAGFEGDRAGLPGDPGLGEGDETLDVVAVVGGPTAPLSGEGAVEQGHGIGGGDGFEEPAVVGAVRVDGDAPPRPGPADMALVAVLDGDCESGPRGADRCGAHAEFAGGDAGDGGQEAFTAVAEHAGEGVVGVEPTVFALEQRLAGEGRWSNEVRQWSTGAFGRSGRG